MCHLYNATLPWSNYTHPLTLLQSQTAQLLFFSH